MMSSHSRWVIDADLAEHIAELTHAEERRDVLQHLPKQREVKGPQIVCFPGLIQHLQQSQMVQEHVVLVASPSDKSPDLSLRIQILVTFLIFLPLFALS